MKKWLKILAVLSTLSMFIILIGGNLVTNTGSSLGMGRSWPFSSEGILPEHITTEFIIEAAHRLATGAGGFIVLLLVIFSWRQIGHLRETKFLGITSLLFIAIQAFLGAAAVLWGQNSYILALHFGISLVAFAAVFLLSILVFEIDKNWNTQILLQDKRLKGHAIALFIYMYFTVYTGALVSHIGATLAALNFPFAGNGWESPQTQQQWVQIGHRIAAMILFVWILCLMIGAWRRGKEWRVLQWGWTSAFIFVLCQAITGVLNVVTRASLHALLSHAFFITCLFGVVSYLMMLSFRKQQAASNEMSGPSSMRVS